MKTFDLRSWKFWISILVSLFFLFLAVNKVNLNELGFALKNANYRYLIIVILFAFMAVWIRALRWHFLLKPIRSISIRSLFSVTMIGLMANNLLPARLGELVRAYALGKKEKIGKSGSFATIVVERFMDGITILFFLTILLLFWRSPFPSWLQKGVFIAIGLYFGTLFFLILLKSFTKQVLLFIRKILHPFPERLREGVLKVVGSFNEGLEILSSFKYILISLILSILVWIIPGFAIYFLLIAMGIQLPVYSSFLLLVILCLGVMIPSAPGYIGTIQFFSIMGLALFEVSKPQALSFSIVYHMSQFIPITIMGLYYFSIEGFSFSQLNESKEEGN